MSPATKNKKSIDSHLLKVLDAVGEHHATNAGEVVTSKTLLKLGVKDSVAHYWEGVLENPLASLYETSQKVEEVFMKFADEIVKSYLIKNNLVSKAYRSENGAHELHYCIVLKENNNSSRTKVNRFFSYYFDFKFAQKYPIHFQFVPENLISKLKVREQII